MDSFMRVTRHAARSLRRSPAFTVSVVLLVALGVGSVSAIFAVVDHVLLRPLPYPSADRLFIVQNGNHSGPSYGEFQTMRSVDAWAAVSTREANLTGGNEPLRMIEGYVTPGFFSLLAARAATGRLLVEEDFRAPDGVVLSWNTWQRVWGGNAGIIGSTIRIDARPLVVLGVLDRGFSPPEALVFRLPDLWRPLDPNRETATMHEYHDLAVVGRVADHATLAHVAREAEGLAERRAREFPQHYRNEDGGVSPLPVEPLQEATVSGVRERLNLMFGSGTLLLLVACANLTHLFLARGMSRTREMSVRRALGAGTRALATQLAAESLLVAALGGALGVVLARVALRTFLLLNPGNLPRAAAIAIDLRVVFFAAGTAMATALIFGLIPALRVAGAAPGNVLRSGGRTITGTRAAQRVRNAIVIAEVAFSLVLMAQAGWLIRSFVRLRQQPLGFRTENVFTIPLNLTGIRSPQEWYTRLEAIRQSLANVPGVQEATFGLTMPLEFTGGSHCCWRGEARYYGRAEPTRTNYHPVDADYFETLGLAIIAGQVWTRNQERADPHPAVVTEPLAVQLFGSAQAAIGQTFVQSDVTFRVAGVVADHKHYGPDQEHGPATFIPASLVPFPPRRAHMAVSITGEIPDLPRFLRQAVWRSEPDLPVPQVRRMADWAGAATARSRFESALFSVFAAVGLLLVAGGLAGTLFYLVSLHRRDMGIRLALGATGEALKRRIVLRGITLAAAGSLIGAAAAWLSGRLLEAQLFGVHARDFRTLTLAIATLLAVAALSSWWPARRAAATDPMRSLRIE